MKIKTLNLICLIAGIVFSISFSQICFKFAALASEGHENMAAFAFWTLSGFFLIGWSFLFSYIILKFRPLSFLYPFSALNFIIIPALSAMIFGTRVSMAFFSGSCLIIAGIALTSLNKKQTS